MSSDISRVPHGVNASHSDPTMNDELDLEILLENNMEILNDAHDSSHSSHID